jgi:hypothetical protein
MAPGCGAQPSARLASQSHGDRMKAALGAALIVAGITISPTLGQSVTRAYTKFDSKQCQHSRGRGVEDYGSWRCKGYDGIELRLSAGDQRMQVSFGSDAAREPAARQTFPAFNNVYEGTVEWRLEPRPNGRPRPFATILRWNVKLEDDERTSTGRILVVTRLGPGGVCHVGYVDARANPDANELAQQVADGQARAFQCGKDKPIVSGKISPGLSMPVGD